MTQTFTYAANGNKQYEIYNTTNGMIHAIQLNKKGERYAPHAKTLLAMSMETFNYGITTKGIIPHA